MANRMLEMAVVIKGRLDGSLGSSAQRAAKQLSDLQTKSRTLTRQLREQEKQLARERAAGGVNESTLRRQLELQRQLNDAVQRRAQLTEALSNRQAAAGQLQTNASRLAGAATAAAVVAAPVVDAIGVAAEYEAAMSKVKAITNSTDEDMRKLDATAKEMGATTQFSARQAAEAMSYLGMAGWKTNEIIAGMPGMLGLAAAGGVDLARVADILSDDLTAFGLSADKAGHMADVFAHVITNTNTDVEKMGETMKYAAPVAAAFGASMEETAAMTGLMANAGIKASQAGTSLRAGFLRLAGPPKMARKAMAELGIEMSDITKQQAETSATLQALGIDMEKMSNMSGPHKMIAVITELQQKMQGLSDEEQLSHLKAIFGTEAATGWLNVIKAGPDALAKLTVELENCDGEAQRVAKTMTDNAKGAWVKLQSAVEGVAISVGSLFLPTLTKFGETLAEKVGDISKWVEAHQDIVKAAAMAVAAIMGLVLAFFALTTVISAINFVKTSWTLFMATIGGEAVAGAGALAMLKGAFIAAFKGMATAILGPLKFIGGVLLHTLLGMVGMVQSLFAGQFVAAIRNGMAMLRGIFLTNPWGWALLALAALLVLVMNNWEKFKEVVSIVMNHVGGTVDAAIARVKQAFGTALDKVTEVWNSITGQSASSAELVGQIFNTLGWLIGGAFDIVVGSVTTAVSVIVNLFASMAQIIGGIINIVVGIITLDMDKVCKGIGQTIDGVLGATLGTIKTIAKGIGDVFDTLMGRASEVQKEAENAVKLQEQAKAVGQVVPGATPGIDDPGLAQAQQVAAATQETAQNAQRAAAGAQELNQNLAESGNTAQSINTQIESVTKGLGNMPAASQEAFSSMEQQAGAGTQAASEALAKLPESVQIVFDKLPPIAQVGIDNTAQEVANLANKCEPGWKEFLAGAQQWSEQAYNAVAQWADQMANVVVEKLGNAWAQISSQFSAGLNVNVTTSGTGVAHNAKGGIYPKGAFLTTFAEDSPEAAIPLDGSKRAISLWQKAGEMLGLMPKGQQTAIGATASLPSVMNALPDINISTIPRMDAVAPALNLGVPSVEGNVAKTILADDAIGLSSVANNAVMAGMPELDLAKLGAGIAHNAEGGIYRKGSFITTFAEEGPEAAIPLDGSSRAVSLWQKAGEMLGVLPQGQPSGIGMVGNIPSSIEAIMPKIGLPKLDISGNIPSAIEAIMPKIGLPKLDMPGDIPSAIEAIMPKIGLPKLDMPGNIPSSIEAVMPKVDLPKLDISGNIPSAIEAIMPKIDLPKLDMPGNISSSIEAVMPKVDLPKLDISGNIPSAIEAIMPKIDLPKLDMPGNISSSIEAVMPKVDLPKLDISGNIPSAIEAIMPKIDLPKLDMPGNIPSSIEAVMPKIGLPKLDMPGNIPSSIEAVMPKIDLPKLDMPGNIPSAIEAVMPKIGLPKLDMPGNIPSSIEAIMPKIDLPKLDISGNIPSAIEAIMPKIDLPKLDMPGDIPSSIEAIMPKIGLPKLDISGNIPSSIEAIMPRIGLPKLDMPGDIPSSIEAVMPKIGLPKLDISGNIPSSIEAIMPRIGLPKLDMPGDIPSSIEAIMPKIGLPKLDISGNIPSSIEAIMPKTQSPIIELASALPADMGTVAEIVAPPTEAEMAAAPVAMEPVGSIGTNTIEINMPAITINGNADAGTVTQLEGLMEQMKADLMREVRKQFPGMVASNDHRERRLSYAT